MSDSFKSKHAGKPGSLLAIRVDYPLSTTAFDEPHAEPVKTRHDEVRKFATGLRIGDQPYWNASTVDEQHPFPSRPPIRSLSEFQGIKMNYNYRAAVLPTINKETVFVRKPNKMQIDESLFLSKKEKEKLVKQCPGTAATLSRQEIQNLSHDVQMENGWNTSTALPSERASVFKPTPCPQRAELNKSKSILNQDTYRSPEVQYHEKSEERRTMKLTARETLGGTGQSAQLRGTGFTRSAGGTTVHVDAPAVFKMSNVSEWWDKNPIALPQEQVQSLSSTTRM